MRRKDLDHSLIQNCVMEALMQLMKTKNYTEISVGEIVARAAVHRATFYRHFTSKDDVLRCCLSRMLKEAEEDRDLLHTDFSAFIRPVFQTFYENRTQMLFLNRAGLSGQLLDVLKDYFQFDAIPDIMTENPAEEADTGCGAGKVRVSTNAEKYRMAYRIGGIYSCLLLWFSHDMQETPEEMTKIAVSM